MWYEFWDPKKPIYLPQPVLAMPEITLIVKISIDQLKFYINSFLLKHNLKHSTQVIGRNESLMQWMPGSRNRIHCHFPKVPSPLLPVAASSHLVYHQGNHLIVLTWNRLLFGLIFYMNRIVWYVFFCIHKASSAQHHTDEIHLCCCI